MNANKVPTLSACLASGVLRGSIAAKCCKFFHHLCEASLTTMRLACEHRYTLQTVTPFVLSSAGVVCDVSGPALGHAAKTQGGWKSSLHPRRSCLRPELQIVALGHLTSHVGIWLQLSKKLLICAKVPQSHYDSFIYVTMITFHKFAYKLYLFL